MAVTGIFLACGQRDDPDEFLRREVAELQKRTIAPGSKVLIQSGPIQDGRGKSAYWVFETSWDWTQYEACLACNFILNLFFEELTDVASFSSDRCMVILKN